MKFLHSPLGTWVASRIGIVAQALRVAEKTTAPIVDLIIRLALAQAFLASALIKIANWDNALYLSANEYAVAWLDPVTAAYLGVAIELFGSILLAAGLATRFAAAALLVLSLIIQLNYAALPLHLFWIVLFGWYVVRGAGALSLDRGLRRGLIDSALPLASIGVRAAASITRNVAPIYQLWLRLWIALTLTGLLQTIWLPAQAGQIVTIDAALLCALLLALGLATRFVALAMIAALTMQMMSAMHADQFYLLMLFALLAIHGAGKWSLDRVLEIQLKKIFPQLDGKPAFALDGLPRVVIVGAGFGGMSCAAALRGARANVTLIDRHNYHLFQPLLYQVATAALSPGDIAMPIRGLFREHFNTRVLLGAVTGVDTESREILIGAKRVPYDYLVLATGATHSYFGRDDWANDAPGLKRVEDALDVRRRLLVAFEQAEVTDDADERRSLLTFLIVGGGPTGVELAGAIAELARFGMEKDFRHFDPAAARVMLVQSGPRILPAFPEKLSATAQAYLEKLGVEVLTGSRVEQIDDRGVLVNGKRIEARTVLWAAGVIASPAARWILGAADKAGRLKVDADLSVPGLPNVFAIGDTAASNAWRGQPVPGLAPAAKQGGQYVAKVIGCRLAGRASPPAFRYTHLGSLATIGRKSAVADFGAIKISGTPAWWLWGLVHVYFLVGLRNRLSIMFDWLWAYLTYRSGTRLITGGPAPAAISKTRKRGGSRGLAGNLIPASEKS